MKPRGTLALLFTLLLSSLLYPQEHADKNTISIIPEVAAFHEVIVPIWHKAYPAKDFAALRTAGGDVKRLAEPILSVALPGILREKADKWNQAKEFFQKSYQEYMVAVAGTDDQRLLKAAEELHRGYEGMVRVMVPVLKEMDAFHRTLYVAYHTDVPGKDGKALKGKVATLAAESESILKAALPKWMEGKEVLFREKARLLRSAVAELEAVSAVENEKFDKPAAALERVHTAYQALEAVFE